MEKTMKLSIKTKLVISTAALALALPVGLHTYGTVTHASTYETTSLSEGKNNFRVLFEKSVCEAYDKALKMGEYNYGSYSSLMQDIKKSKEVVTGQTSTIIAANNVLNLAQKLAPSLSTVDDFIKQIEKDYKRFEEEMVYIYIFDEN